MAPLFYAHIFKPTVLLHFHAAANRARLWQAQMGGWSVNDIICERVLWDQAAMQTTEYAPGEFERLHFEGVKVTLHYEGGIERMEVLTLPMLLKELEAQHEGCVLRLKSIEDAPGGANTTIVIDKTGGEDPAKLSAELTAQAHKLQIVQRRLVTEQHLKLRLEAQVELLSDLMRDAMSKQKQINFHGNIGAIGTIGDITDSAKVSIKQSTHYRQTDLEKIADLITDMLAHRADLRADLSTDDLDILDASLQTIRNQLAQQPSPDQSLISKCLRSVKTILEGAAGNVLASGWLKVLEALGLG